MNHGSLFSGIGGFDLAAEWMGWDNIFHCEKDKKARAVLKKNFPLVESHKDIFKLDAKKYKGSIDIITGGFPCQPFSLAGKRKGRNDDRYLWPEMLRIISESKPTYVVGENVYGLVNMENGKTLDKIYSDLENEGYQVESFIIPACSIGAWHRRDRIWIIAYSNQRNDRRKPRAISEAQKEKRLRQQYEMGIITDASKAWLSDAGKLLIDFNGCTNEPDTGGDREKDKIPGINRPEICRGNFGRTDIKHRKEIITDTDTQRLQRNRECGKGQEWKNTKRFTRSSCGTWNGWEAEPGMGRVVNGLSGRVDRIKQLGNAIVPQVAYEIFNFIQRLDDSLYCA